MADEIESLLLARLRDLRDDRPVTEAELRALIDEAGGWARSLRAQVDASERRLERLSADPEASLIEIAGELRRVDHLHPALTNAYDLVAQLEARARRLRTGWLLRQATDEHRPVR